MKNQIAIIGCGDIGLRIAQRLCVSGISAERILPIVRSESSQTKLLATFSETICLDLDIAQEVKQSILSDISELYYLVPPQKSGDRDLRSQQLLKLLANNGTSLQRIVLISTTGVYGDCQGEYVTEQTPLNPTTPRSQRRADMEQQWLSFAEQQQCILSVLRVPGIYSFSRLPRKRLEAQAPIVNPEECGFTNRIHADDLAMICTTVMSKQTETGIYNATDGMPGKMSQYFIDVAEFLGLAKPQVMSFVEAEKLVTTEMMSYLKESRKISNKKLLATFNLKLSYEDYREGMCF